MSSVSDFQKATTEAKQTFDKMGETSREATHAMKESYSMTMKGAQDYTTKVLEFAQANANSAFEYVKKLSSVKSPTEFFELSNTHIRQQFETLSKQANELTALTQKMTIATNESIKSGIQKVV